VSRDPLNRQRGRVVIGAFIIVIGLFALLDNLHVFDSRLVQPFWPLVLVALGALRLAHDRRQRQPLFGVALMVIGAGLVLRNLGLLDFDMRDLWPVVLILVGLSVITRGFRQRIDGQPLTPPHAGAGTQRDEHNEHGARIDASAMMSGIVLKNDSQEFAGGEVNAVMGSVEIDLRQAAIATEAVLNVSVIMGGVEIKVPRDWSVSVNGTPMLGGIEDKTLPPLVPGKRLIIEGSVIMGGVEISN
jgi:predicted membrane protein